MNHKWQITNNIRRFTKGNISHENYLDASELLCYQMKNDNLLVELIELNIKKFSSNKINREKYLDGCEEILFYYLNNN